MNNLSAPLFLLDLDGVSVDFVGTALRLFDLNLADISWPPGQYEIADVLGIDRNLFWENINAAGVEFWRGMAPYPWFEDLYRELSLRGKVCFATSPTYSPNSAAGKMAWLKDRFGSDFKEFIITRRKHHLSKPNAILIDDSDRNVRDFVQKGSERSVLFPQIWNSAYPLADGNRLEYVLKQVDALIGEMGNA